MPKSRRAPTTVVISTRVSEHCYTAILDCCELSRRSIAQEVEHLILKGLSTGPEGFIAPELVPDLLRDMATRLERKT